MQDLALLTICIYKSLEVPQILKDERTRGWIELFMNLEFSLKIWSLAERVYVNNSAVLEVCKY